ncbi:MAG: tetratricopeptide repeat protein [Candidatus Hatepunaea meridiana]|nr:tetratricopeptide repeat protein [Candidatus Hatepunaea meridiana]
MKNNCHNLHNQPNLDCQSTAADSGLCSNAVNRSQDVQEPRCCEERRDEAISLSHINNDIASLRSQQRRYFCHSRTTRIGLTTGVIHTNILDKRQFIGNKLAMLMFTALISIMFITSIANAENPGETLNRAKTLEQHGVLMEAITVYEDYLKQRPGDNNTRKILVELLLRLNRLPQAIPHIDKLRRAKPDDKRVKEFAALAANYRANIYNRKVKDYENRLQSSGESPAILLEYARYLCANRKTNKGIAMYKKYLAKNTKDDNVRFELAQRYAWSKNFNASFNELSLILTRNSRHVKARMLIGNIYYWQGNEESALFSYRKVLEVKPNDKDAKEKIERIVNTPGYRAKRLVEEAERNPTGEALNILARHYMEVGREWEADSLVKRRLTAVPDDAVAQKIAAEIEIRKLKRNQKKIAVYESKLQDNPKDTTALLNLARYYVSVPDFPKAIEAYDVYLELYPLDYTTRLNRATALSWAGRSDEAAEEFRIISITLPDSRKATLGLADAFLISDKNVEEAEEIYKQDLQSHPDDPRSKIGYAEALRRQGKYDDAKAVYKEILKGDSLDIQAKQGLDWLDKDVGPMVKMLEIKVKESPDDIGLRRRLAGLLYDTHRYFEAAKHIKILLEEDPNNTRLRSFLTEVEEKKIAYRKKQLVELKIWVSEHPEDMNARIKYADMLAQEGQAKKAAAQYRLVLESQQETIGPFEVDDTKYLQKLAEQLIANQEVEKAMEIYAQIAEENPGNFDYRFQYALVLSWTGKYDRSLIEFEGALRLNPESMECHLAMADIYRWQGNPYAALDEYNHVVAINPDNELAQNALDELNEASFRGIRGVYRNAQDNEDFKLRELYCGAVVSISLRMKTEAGLGKMYFEQTDSTDRFLFSENAWFLYGNLDYHFDPLTLGNLKVRRYTFANRKSTEYRLELSHDFQDVEELHGLWATVFYSSRDAVFDIASTMALQTWQDSLRCDKFGLIGKYTNIKKWIIEGELAYLAISDGNGRTDLWSEGRYLIQKHIQVGARYDAIKAESQKEGYWTPVDKYTTLSGVIVLQNKFPRWNYKLRASFGKVLTTGDATRNISGIVQYRLQKAVYLGLAYSNLLTNRVDGRYEYSGFTASLTWSR